MTIYCVIARDPESGDEWVMPKTFETIMETAEYAETCRIEDPTARYRLENVEPTVSVPYREIAKDTLNKLLTQSKMNYADTDSLRMEKIRTEDFTTTELFGNQLGERRNGEIVKACIECGALIVKHERHVSWHNKLLP